MLTRGLLWRLTSLTLILLHGRFTLPAQCLYAGILFSR